MSPEEFKKYMNAQIDEIRLFVYLRSKQGIQESDAIAEWMKEKAQNFRDNWDNNKSR